MASRICVTATCSNLSSSTGMPKGRNFPGPLGMYLRKDAASGVDGMTFQQYEKNLEANLDDLVGRLKRKAYRARLGRAKNILKGPGKFRPLGIPVLEDKLLQVAATQILLAIC